MIRVAAVMAFSVLASISSLIFGTSHTASDFAPWVSGGSAATAVAGIVYIAKLMASGRLVARDPAEEARALRDLNERVEILARTSLQREQTYIELLTRRHDQRRADKNE